jgi:hypothetical protein
MFDYGDVIAYLLLVLQNMPPPEEGDTFEIKDIVRRALEGQEVPVKLASGKVCVCGLHSVYFVDISFCIDLSKKNPFYSILPDTSLLTVVEQFACGTHRSKLVELFASGWKFFLLFSSHPPCWYINSVCIES